MEEELRLTFLCGKYFSKKYLSFSSCHNLTCYIIWVPKTLHCRNTDQMMLPDPQSLKSNWRTTTKPKDAKYSGQQRKKPMAVPDKQEIQYAARLFATAFLQRRMVSLLKEGWIRLTELQGGDGWTKFHRTCLPRSTCYLHVFLISLYLQIYTQIQHLVNLWK